MTRVERPIAIGFSAPTDDMRLFSLGVPLGGFLMSRLILRSKLFVAPHWVSFLFRSSATKAMGCFVDIVWYDLNATPERGRANPHFSPPKKHSQFKSPLLHYSPESTHPSISSKVIIPRCISNTPNGYWHCLVAQLVTSKTHSIVSESD